LTGVVLISHGRGIQLSTVTSPSVTQVCTHMSYTSIVAQTWQDLLQICCGFDTWCNQNAEQIKPVEFMHNLYHSQLY